MAAIVREAYRYGLRVAAHAVSEKSIRDAALAGVDSIEHAYSLSDETIQLLKEKNIFVVPTLMSSDSFTRYMEISGEAAGSAQSEQSQPGAEQAQPLGCQRADPVAGHPADEGAEEHTHTVPAQDLSRLEDGEP